ncbi:MAG: signal peptidase I [Opitutae bacterium]|nr:signal peptidase I [Opitutae bacterium]
MRRHAANWLEVADRVYKFRRDQLTGTQGQQLVAAAGELKLRLKERADASKLKLAIERLEVALRDVGGRHYPASSLVENVEFFLVAAIVILGLRAYFVQPFKIPTNSMWPSYYGMTHELIEEGKEPGALGRLGRLLAFGATNYSVTAPASGEVLAGVVAYDSNYVRMIGSEKTGRSLLLFPSAHKEYTFMVNGSPAKLEVPADFDLDRVLEEKLGLKRGTLGDYLLRQARTMGAKLESSAMTVRLGGRSREARVYWVPLNRTVQAGAKILSFDILTGDLLFVDRITYNFAPPKVGQGFVFKTENIHSPSMEDAAGNQIQQYYIKRLVGLPGDKLEVRAPNGAYNRDGGARAGDTGGQLFRNGAPITGAEAFAANAKRLGKFPGYTGIGLLEFGRVAEVPAHSFMALGDNSPASLDSRYWGFIPEKDVVGKPLFIYYPLTSRWGIAP